MWYRVLPDGLKPNFWTKQYVKIIIIVIIIIIRAQWVWER